jgi:DNA-binding NtrC family response regulator
MDNLIMSNLNTTIMIVDDDDEIRKVVCLLFEEQGCKILQAENGRKAVELCEKESPDVVLMDISMPEMNGLEACAKIRSNNITSNVPILLITSLTDRVSIEEGFAAGATDYITKPFNWIILKHRVLHLARVYQAEQKVASLQQWQQIQHYINSQEQNENLLVGNGTSFATIQMLIQKAASTSASVLITGETGTGKNVVAKAIHRASESRQKKAFISINCAALPEHLIEAELFGAEKGAYTGAIATHKGVFELADGGILFLDEIGEMPIALQAKLLAVIEEQKIKRLGGEQSRNIDVKIIAATNVDPEKAVESGKLRDDLFYRLSVINIQVPPLRERTEDIPLLCYHFIKKFAPNRELTISDAELDLLKQYPWPGNVRELRNILERCVILQNGPKLYPTELIKNFEKKSSSSSINKPKDTLIATLEEVERQHILKVFNQLGKNQTHTAKALDVSLTTLKRKLKEYNISS